VAEATPWPKMGWPGHPIFGKGVAPATPISFILLLLFFFSISFFFSKKKILKFAKLRRFAQNGVVLE
jgi:hypothetical protein